MNLTICKEYIDDWNHFCNCFDKSGKETTNTASAYYACCKCPEELREAIKNVNIHVLETQAMLPSGQTFVVDNKHIEEFSEAAQEK